jgi:hypothetical protein
MTLQRQTISMPLSKGVNTKVDEKQLPLGDLLILENATFETLKKIRKRPGTSRLGAGLGVSAQALLARGGELLLADLFGRLRSYTGDISAAAWTNKGALPSVGASVVQLGATQYTVADVDAAADSGSGLVCSVFQLVDQNASSGPAPKGLAYSVYDTKNGQVITPPTVFDATTTSCVPRVVSTFGSKFSIYWLANTGSPSILQTTVDASLTLPPPAPAAGVVITSGTTTSAAAGQVIDAKQIAGNVYVSFKNRSGSLTVFRLSTSTPAAVASSAVVGGSNPTASCIAFDSLNLNVLVGWIDGTSNNSYAFAAYDPTLATQIQSAFISPAVPAGFVFTRITASGNQGSSIGTVFFASGESTLAIGFLARAIYSSQVTGGTYGTVTNQKLIGAMVVAGQAFQVSGTGVAYVPAWFTTSGGFNVGSTQSALYLVDSSGNVISASLVGSVGALSAIKNFGTISGVPGPSAVGSTVLPVAGGSVAWCAQAQSLRRTGGGSVSTFAFAPGAQFVDPFQYQYGPAIAAFDCGGNTTAPISRAGQYLRGEIAGTMHTSGGLLYMYDGSSAVEHGFLYYPYNVTASQATASGLLTVGGTYSYAVTYEWMDAQGQVHRSAPGFLNGTSITLTGGNNTVTLTIPTLRCTQKINVQITVWRTLNNGSVYSQVNNYGNSPFSQLSPGSLFNDKSVDTVTWTDGLPDSTIQSHPQLYTTGGVLANFPANPVGPLVVHRNRVFAVDSTAPTVVQYSKLVVRPAPVEFSPFNVMNVDPRGGDVTALGSLDDKLVVFKRDRILVVYGQGPDATGGNNDFSDAIPVTTDTGCDAPKSVVNVPGGLMFHSPKGYYLLDRALQVTYLGAPVEAFNGDVVDAAVLMEDRHQVRFVTQSRRFIVYDYVAGQWSVYTFPGAGVNGYPSGKFLGGAVWQGQFVFAAEDGSALVEEPLSAPTFSDAGNYIPMKVQPGWFSAADVQGAQRIWKLALLGTWRSTHALSVSLAFDYEPDTQTNTFSVTSDPAPYQFSVKPRQQRCEAMRVTISDGPIGGATSGEGFDLSSLSAEFGVEGKLRQTPRGQTGG